MPLGIGIGNAIQWIAGVAANSAIGFEGLLDTYSGAAAAYSVRLLKSDYGGNNQQIRRSSDNALQNIGFSSNIFNAASALTFTGANDGLTRDFYDQSGATNNLQQTTNSIQPTIISSGSLVTLNSKAALDFSSGKFLEFSNVWEGGLMPTKSSFSVVLVADFSTSGSLKNLLGCVNTASDRFVFRQQTTGEIFIALGNNTYTTTMQFNSANEGLILNVIVTGGNYDLHITRLSDENTESWTSETISGDWGTISSGLTGTSFGINNFSGSGSGLEGKLNELVYWNENKYSDLAGISSNIKTFYSI